MIDIMKKFFDRKADATKESQTGHDINIATCAILLEMANIDGEFDEAEKKKIALFFSTHTDHSQEEIQEIMDASAKELENSIDLWKFTNMINQNYSVDEKIRIIETIWSVAYSDGTLDKHEDYLVHKLSNLLRLSHKQLIDSKLKVKQ